MNPIKKNILLMGKPGVGKTTLVKKLIGKLQGAKLAGFFTEEVRGPDGVRIGFGIRTLDGKTGRLAAAGLKSTAHVGKYGVDLGAIESVINPAIENALRESEFLILDEIGKMETTSRKFQTLVEQAFDSKIKIIATIPIYKLPLVEKLKQRPDVSIFKVNAGNRDQLSDRINRNSLSL